MNDRTQQPVVDVKVKTLTAQGAQDKLEARLYTPAGTPGQAGGLIVFFPYGGFMSIEMDDAEGCATALAARTGYRVLMSSYTTAVQQPFPAAVEDAHAVLKWAVRNRARLGWDGKRLITAGIEAGGKVSLGAARGLLVDFLDQGPQLLQRLSQQRAGTLQGLGLDVGWRSGHGLVDLHRGEGQALAQAIV